MRTVKLLEIGVDVFGYEYMITADAEGNYYLEHIDIFNEAEKRCIAFKSLKKLNEYIELYL